MGERVVKGVSWSGGKNEATQSWSKMASHYEGGQSHGDDPRQV